MDEMSFNPKVYSDPPITLLSSVECIRHRPSMYIGSIDARGLHYLVFELVDASIFEWSAGTCKRIGVEVLADGGCCVYDDGEGIPVDVKEPYNQRVAELLLTCVFCGTKFGHRATGMHGVGLVTINALSKRMLIRISRDGKRWEQEYHRGIAVAPMEAMCETSETGTCITFWPDPEIFGNCTFDSELIKNRLRELSFLNPGLDIRYRDGYRVESEGELFVSCGGVGDYIQHMNRAETAVHPYITFRTEGTDADGRPSTVDAAVQWVASPTATTRSFANTYETTEGGTHVTGFRRGLSRAVRTFVKAHSDGITGRMTVDDVLHGLTAILSVHIADPQFSSQTRARLNNPEIASFVERVVFQEVLAYLNSNPKDANSILERIRRG